MSSTERKKVAFIGPVSPPYRGGIAQYTTNLTRALGDEVDLQVYSFKIQYPMFLYPGESDRDSNDFDPNVYYKLSIYSPLSWRRCALDIIKQGNKVVIISWWTFVWAVPFMYITRLLKKHGVKVTFLTHNLFDHDGKSWSVKLSKVALRSADSYIVHVEDQESYLKSVDGTKPILRRLHPVYDHFPSPRKVKKPRGRLDLLYFGFIRPYKGVDVLLEAMKLLDDSDVYLTIVGEAWGEEREDIIRNSEILGNNVDLHLSYMNDAQAANYFNNCDVVVLPYRAATGSGVVALAYYYGKPVIASSVGGFIESVVNGRTGWLVKPNSASELAEVIRTTKREDIMSTKKPIAEFCRENSWSAMASSIVKFIEKN